MQALIARRGLLLSSQQTLLRCASTEASPPQPHQQQPAKPRASKQLPDVDIGGVKFSNVETAWKAEQFESKRKSRSSQSQQQQQQPRRRSGAQQDDGSIDTLLQESSPATTGDVAFTVPNKRKQRQKPSAAQAGKKSSGQGQGQQQQQKKKQASRPRQVGPVFGADAMPDLPMPSSVKDTGRYLTQNSGLLSSLRQVPKAPLGSYAKAQGKLGGDGLGERVLGQNGSFSQRQKAALLDVVKRLAPQAQQTQA